MITSLYIYSSFCLYVCNVDEGQRAYIYTQVLLLLLYVLYNKTSIMKQLWSVLFFLTFALFSLPLGKDNSCINRPDTIVKISLFFSFLSFLYYSQSVSDWPYPCIYIYIHVIRNTHLHTGWRRKTNDI
jgi:hypothetical protein